MAGDAPLVLGLTMLLTIVSLLPPGSAAAVMGIAALALTVIGWRRRAQGASSLGVLFVTCLALALAGFGPQQAVFGVAFVIYAGVAYRVPWFREATSWFKVGRISNGIVASGAVFAAISGATLLFWYVSVRPDLTDLVVTFIPDWPLWLIAPAALLFSLVNAAVEEAAYRGVVLGALNKARITSPAALVLQAMAFAALHFRAGFPRGVVGVELTFVYGLVLGEICRRAGGLMAPFITHVLTDMVIVTIVLALVRA